MALSTYFNFETLQIPNLETNTFHEAMPEEVAAPNLQQLFPYSDESFFLSDALFENYIDPTGGFLYPPDCCYEEQQRQQEHVYSSSLQEFTTPTLPSSFLDGFVIPYDNCCSLQAEELQQKLFSETQYGDTCVDLPCEKKGNERTISPQSVAARERRRKITKKTQELGKLVPGGPKMNTAEMLHAAGKYVMYLQAQVGMLELMNTLEQEDKAEPPPENLHALVASPFVQEKLYTEERCFVPKEVVTTLTNHKDVQSRPTILKDLKQLIGTDIEKKAKQE
ncbi:hypothetical protein JHK87_021496 [Glycine soja]|nr:hypothetical protein JHK87_021496 [Glycine soja]